MPEINPYYQWFAIDKSIASPDAFQLLGIPRNASPQQVEKAYQQRLAILNAFKDGHHHDLATQLERQVEQARQQILKTFSQPKEPPQETPSESAVESPAISTRSRTRRRTRSRKKTSIGKHIVFSLIPSVILISIIVFSPSTLTRFINGIRTAVYGPPPSNEPKSEKKNKDEKKSTEASTKKKVRKGSSRSRPRQKTENLRKTPVTSESTRPGNKTDTQLAKTPTRSTDPDDGNSSKAKELNAADDGTLRPDWKLVEFYVDEFSRLPADRPRRLIEKAEVEIDSAKKYAIFVHAMNTAKRESNVDALLAVYRKWREHFSISWERELLERIVDADFSQVGKWQQLANHAPYLFQRCREDVCVDNGLKLAEMMLARAREFGFRNVGYLSNQKQLFEKSKKFNWQPASVKKAIFEFLFTNDLQITPGMPEDAAEFFDKYLAFEKMLDGPLAPELTQIEKLKRELQAAADALKLFQSAEKATVLLVDEKMAVVERKVKLLAIKSKLDWTDGINRKYELTSPELYTVLSPDDALDSTKFDSPILIQQSPNSLSTTDETLNGFCGKKSLLFSSDSDGYQLYDPFNGRVANFLFSRERFRAPFGSLSNNVVVDVFSNGQVLWKDILTNKSIIVETGLVNTTGKHPYPAFRPDLGDKFAITSPRNDIVILNDSKLNFVRFPSTTARTRPTMVDVDIEKPYGVFSNGKNVVAVVGSSEIAIFQGRTRSRNISINKLATMFAFSAKPRTYFVADRDKVIKISDSDPEVYVVDGLQGFDRRITSIYEVAEDYLLLGLQFTKERHAIQLVHLNSGKLKLVQELLVESGEFTMSPKRDFIGVVKDDGSVTIYAIVVPAIKRS